MFVASPLLWSLDPLSGGNAGIYEENGNTKTEQLDGFDVQIILHEIDHLDGILFIDRLLEQKKPLYEHINGEWERVELM
jgi:hypothetical protein